MLSTVLFSWFSAKTIIVLLIDLNQTDQSNLLLTMVTPNKTKTFRLHGFLSRGAFSTRAIVVDENFTGKE